MNPDVVANLDRLRSKGSVCKARPDHLETGDGRYKQSTSTAHNDLVSVEDGGAAFGNRRTLPGRTEACQRVHSGLSQFEGWLNHTDAGTSIFICAQDN